MSHGQPQNGGRGAAVCHRSGPACKCGTECRHHPDGVHGLCRQCADEQDEDEYQQRLKRGVLRGSDMRRLVRDAARGRPEALMLLPRHR